MWVNKCVKECVGKEKRPEGEVFYQGFHTNLRQFYETVLFSENS